MNELSTTDKNLLALLSNVLFQNELTLEDEDWTSIFDEANLQAVIPLVSSAVPDTVPAEVYDKWSTLAVGTLAANAQVDTAHAELHKLLVEANIPYVFLKGYASAAYYPDPIYRSMGDVDFLVRKDDVDRTRKLLTENGFQFEDLDNEHHLSFYNDGITYELHFAVNGVPDGAAREITEEYLCDCIETAVKTDTEFGTMLLPDVFHHGLTILLHTARHMISSGLGLRHLCDWAVFVSHVDDFQGVFKEAFQKMGIWTFACQLTAVCCKFLHMSEQSWDGVWSDEFLNALILDILDSGNFGNKKENNREEWLLSNVSSGGLGKKNFFLQIIHTTNEVTKQHWPVARKLIILHPIGWLFFGGRYIARMITGKREKINVNKMITNASKRRELYEDFHLFEI